MNTVFLMVALLTADAPNAAGVVRVVERVADPFDACLWAAADIATLKDHERPFTFYVWGGPNQDTKTAALVNLVVNKTLSQSSAMQYPVEVAEGRLLRYNLRNLTKSHDLPRLAGVMNYLVQNEPYWHLNLTELGRAPIEVPPFVWIDGKTYTLSKSGFQSPTAELYLQLVKETGLLTPLLHAGDFSRRLLSSYEDEGGIYYDAVGFKIHGKPLNEGEIFAKLGASTAVSRTVEGDDRVGVLHSKIAGNKPRVVEAIQGAVGAVRITYDVNDGTTRGSVRRHLMYNLIDAVNRANGKEVIFERSNNLFGYILTDGKGALVLVGPQKLVTDHRVPEPYTANLFPPLSCIRCHANTGGVKACPNDVPALISRDGVNIFDDLTQRTPDDAIDRLKGLYGGGTDFDERLATSRIKYGQAVYKATGRKFDAKTAGDELANLYGDYWYKLIDAEQQLLEYGWKARSPQAAVAALRVLMKPDSPLPIVLDEPLVYAPSSQIRQLPNSRTDHERIFGEGYKRAARYRLKDLNAAIAEAKKSSLEVAP